jgi:hypothetical protein
VVSISKNPALRPVEEFDDTKRELRNLNAKHDGAGTFELRIVGLHRTKSGTDIGGRGPITAMALVTGF